MRWGLLLAAGVIVPLTTTCALSQTIEKSQFKVVFDPTRDVSSVTPPAGQAGLWFSIKFKIIRQGNNANELGKEYKVVVYHDKREVARLDVPAPKLSEEISAVLAIDVSGSMAKEVAGGKSKRIDQARLAALSFVDRLPARAECGLILFDHEIRPTDRVSPSQDRFVMREIIQQMSPRGGTAYLDAVQAGIGMLAQLKVRERDRQRAVVVMTDGIDLNSTAKLTDVIKFGQQAKVKVHCVGIGEPGGGKPVNSVLVLDHSKSMEQRADEQDKRPKIEALHKAASRFVTIMPDSAKTTVLPFNSKVGIADPFSNNRDKLIRQINQLRPQGETAMLDAAFEGIATLEAANLKGHKAVVVMTDGIDNRSRHRPEEVVRRAKDAKVAVHMLALGRESELKQATPDMKMIAKQTGGSFHHARNEKDLIRIFEEMSNALHDDGIDVKSLSRLAQETGGKYFAAQDINKLKLILEEVSQELAEKEYTVTFAAPHGYDGSAHKFAINLVTSSGEVVTREVADVAVRGVVIAQMSPFVYLAFLGVLVLMLAIPATLGRMRRSTG